ncbi:MAG: hypothetical protein AAGD92_07550 [Pseudomonadota bacterium]
MHDKFDNAALNAEAQRLLAALEAEVGTSAIGKELIDRAKRRLLGGAALGAAAMAVGAGAQAQEPAEKARLMLVYTTDTNSTRQVAVAVQKGVESVEGVDLDMRILQTGREVSHDDMLACDGLIMGTPVRHRNMHHRLKVFVEEVLELLWLKDTMVGMVGATFSVGGGHGDAGAGAENCQLGMLSAMAANGLVIIPLPKQTPGMDHAGCHWGPAVRTGGPKMESIWPSESALTCAYHHGANVARAVKALKPYRKTIFASGNISPTRELADVFLSARGSAMATAEQVPEAGTNPAYRKETHELYPSGDGFETRDG